jgi:hypothetical protein
MFGWTTKVFVSKAPSIAFADATAAFSYACARSVEKIKSGTTLPAIVVKVNPEGARYAGTQQELLLRVCSLDGGFEVITDTKGPGWPKLQVGDLVEWMAGQYSSLAAERHKDVRRGWMGQAVSKLSLEFTPKRGWTKEFQATNEHR